MFKDNFSRYEFKFPMTFEDMHALIYDMAPHVAMDANAGKDATYVISSIYLDNEQKECYYETINGDYFRQKVRLRVYGTSNTLDSPSYLEIKAKIDGLVVKRRVKMVLRDALAFIEDCVKNGYDFDISKYQSTNPQILSELRHVIASKNLKPVNVVSYTRLAYFDKENPDLRITFDYDIKTRGEDLDLTHEISGKPSLPDGVAILEVKTAGEIPMWLVKILGKYGYKNQTFSKYCSFYSPNKIYLRGRKDNTK